MTNNFKKIRTNLGLTLKQLAAAIGVSTMTICHYEKGKRRPRPEICYRIIEYAKKHNITACLEDFYFPPD